MTADKLCIFTFSTCIDGRPFSEIYARQLISKISREELEDKYLRLQEDNQVCLLVNCSLLAEVEVRVDPLPVYHTR